MTQSNPEPKASSFIRLMEWPTAIALGALIAFLFSLKQVNPEVRFELGVGTLIALVIGTLLSWWLVRTVFRSVSEAVPAGETHARRAQKRKMILFILVLGLGTVGSLIYSLKDVSAAKRFDVFVGTGAALAAVAMALYGFWRLVQFLEKHGLPEETAYSDPKDKEDPASEAPESKDRPGA